MSRLGIYLKKEEHQKALLSVMVFTMLIVLVSLLLSLKVPSKAEAELPVPIEIELAEWSAEPAEPDPEKIANAVPSAIEKGIEDIEAADPVSENLPDHTFTFTQSEQVSGTVKFGDDLPDNLKGNLPLKKANRKVLEGPTLTGQTQEEGNIALKIWVDAKGHVVETHWDEAGSTSGNSYLIQLAKKAAGTLLYEPAENKPVEFVGVKIFQFKKH